MKKNLIFLLMFVAQNIMADVTVQIDGIDNATVKAKMERTMSAFLTEVNNAQSSKRALNFGGMGLSTNVQSSVSMLWENSPFECTDEEIIEHWFRLSGAQHPPHDASKRLFFQRR